VHGGVDNAENRKRTRRGKRDWKVAIALSTSAGGYPKADNILLTVAMN
jgi:hypothetical protein